MHDLHVKPLQGKTALVTGGARRLGRSSAMALAHAGADVAITFMTSAREARETVVDLSAHGVRAFAFRCDVTDEASVRSMMKEAGRELGRIDVLVNNAANYETAEWMRRKRGKSNAPIEAKIVNMGSLGGLRPWATHAHYCSSKAALHMLTKVMAKALAPEIAVNAVAPGMIDLGEKAAAAFMRRMAKQTPMRRNGRGDEIAAAVLFFATAPQFVTGQILAVDGGLGL